MDKVLKLRRTDPVGFFNSVKKIIEDMTEVTNNHVLTPELKLRLVTRQCKLWSSPGEQSPFQDPYWAFYWPGGQALTRYLLENSGIIKNKQVLDLGSGCGSLAIAAALAGSSSSILANDIDPVAAVAIQLNAELNKVNRFEISTEDLLKSTCKFGKNSCILLGDMFYNDEFSQLLMRWLFQAVKQGADVYIGDPGRCFNVLTQYKDHLHMLAHYNICEHYREEFELGSNRLFVWKLCR